MEQRVVEKLQQLSAADLADLCAATRSGIEAGGGFGWVEVPPTADLETHWRTVLATPHTDLFVIRHRRRIMGSGQLVRPIPKNQAGAHITELGTFFVASEARGLGLGRKLLTAIVDAARDAGFEVLCLGVRETLKPAIALYESMGFRRWGTRPKYARIDGVDLAGHYYILDL